MRHTALIAVLLPALMVMVPWSTTSISSVCSYVSLCYSALDIYYSLAIARCNAIKINFPISSILFTCLLLRTRMLMVVTVMMQVRMCVDYGA